METIPLDLAFARLGASISGRQRPVWATAQDGSLVLVCQSSGFSRPGAGILRYSARLSAAVRSSQVEGLRQSLEAARSSGTSVRLIVHTRGTDGASGRIHVRADLQGSVVAFDGEDFSVDFVRPAEPDPEPAPAVHPRRKRR